MKLPRFKCKICGQHVPPFTESQHLKENHNIVVKKTSDLVNHFEAYYVGE